MNRWTMDLFETQSALEAELAALRAENHQLRAVVEGLELSERRLRGIFEQTTIGLSLVDSSGRLLMSNPALQAMLQYDADELAAKSHRDVSYPDDLPLTERFIAEMVSGQRDSFQVEKRYVRRDGSVFWASSRVVRVLEPGRQRPNSLLIVEDLTERRKAGQAIEESLGRYRDLAAVSLQQQRVLQGILHHVPHAVFWKDVAGRYLGCNENFAQDAGLRSIEAIVGMTDFDLPWTPEQAAYYRRCDRAVIESGESLLNFEETQLQSDGTQATLLTSKVPLYDPDGAVEGVLGIYVDITPRKRMEEELRQKNEQLMEVDRLKSAFIGSVSHELRTPLTSIRGYGEFLEDQLGGPLTADQAEYVARIMKSSAHLQGLVDDLLDFARMEAGAFAIALSSAELGAKIREVIESFQPQGLEKGVRLTASLPDGPLLARMDAARVGQVLINLVGNALKFTPPDGRIEVGVSEDAAEWRVTVSDSGLGIAAENLPQLFERFYQVDPSNTHQTGGTGLGLSISKALVEAHGGRIGVTSRLGEGSTFWFTLPRA